jgi:hypothetical protein
MSAATWVTLSHAATAEVSGFEAAAFSIPFRFPFAVGVAGTPALSLRLLVGVENAGAAGKQIGGRRSGPRGCACAGLDQQRGDQFGGGATSRELSCVSIHHPFPILAKTTP